MNRNSYYVLVITKYGESLKCEENHTIGEYDEREKTWKIIGSDNIFKTFLSPDKLCHLESAIIPLEKINKDEVTQKNVDYMLNLCFEYEERHNEKLEFFNKYEIKFLN